MKDAIYNNTSGSSFEYQNMLETYKFIDDCLGGNDTIKKHAYKTRDNREATKGEEVWSCRQYLPKTHKMFNDKSDGERQYSIFLQGALFGNFAGNLSQDMIGILHDKEAEITLPDQLSYMEKNATERGETIYDLMKRINTNQIRYGRCGLVAEITEDLDAPFNLIPIDPRRIINWQTSFTKGEEVLQWVLVNNTEYVNNGFSQELKEKYLLYALDGKGNYYQRIFENELPAIDNDQIANPPADGVTYPKRSGKMAKSIPFVFANIMTITSTMEKSILAEHCYLDLNFFQRSADYNWASYMHSNPIPVIKSANKKMGENIVDLGGTSGISLGVSDSAEYLETSGNGFTSKLDYMKYLQLLSASKGMELVNTSNRSGSSLEIEANMRTSKLTSIANTGGNAITKLIELLADWDSKINLKELSIKPNTDFNDAKLTPLDLINLATLHVEHPDKYTSQDFLNSLYKDGYTESNDIEQQREVYEEYKDDNIDLPVMEGVHDDDRRN